MAESTLLATLELPVLLGLLGSLLVELGLKPSPLRFWQRPLPSLGLHLGTWLLLFTLLLLLTQRPWFTLAAVFGLQLFLVVVNNVKHASLKEPFLFQDFEYFWDMLKHPRLYIPFFGWWRTLLSSGGAIAVISAGLALEPAFSSSVRAELWIIAAGLLLLALGLLGYGISLSIPERFHPEGDFRRWGQIAFFWIYARALLRSIPIDTRLSPFLGSAKTDAERPLPNIVAVQSESFFDPRSLSPLIKDSLLHHYDGIISQSLSHGRLDVPAWGANTVRTECGFLTGLTPDALGIHAFNPYYQLAKNEIPNLASHLRAQGYRTLCIHPYHASFYLRDKVFPQLGFDEFIDIRHFSDTQKQGQYIGDAAVADKVTELLKSAATDPAAKPLFIFVITMENHGPLHLEKPDIKVVEQYCHQPLPAGCDDLAVYLGHIRNADLMLAQLTKTLSQGHREGLLCWYGDHLPIMPTVYEQMQAVDGRTQYLIWRSDNATQTRKKQPQDLSVDQLAAKLMGLRL